MLTHLVSHPFEQMAAAEGLLMGGVFERHPSLPFVFLESDCGWLPCGLVRLDGHAEPGSHKLDLKKKPSEADRKFKAPFTSAGL